MPLACLAALCLSGAVAIDGDTLRLDSPGKDLRLRLWGINAPEAKAPGGGGATRALTRIVADRTLACDLKDVDRYGRPVVRCEAEGRDIACEMVRMGHATDWPLYSKDAMPAAATRTLPATIRRPPGEEPGGRRALDLFPARGEDAQQRDDRGAQHVIAHMA
ncbi:thermonuclease family protein [Paracoccus yeei]|uniref:Thermonuclease family protein n=1 Tax=Paracoccus yeei TaxID=147645 RepID=A0A5P2QSY8_9RHOB|nr:thermonuclease family protein [Paracoccus yeei]QEU08693.1 thermonuclease family protein [Paracoccus yeei]